MYILPNISRSKGNQTMKFGQLMEYNKIIFYFKSRAENEAGTLFPDVKGIVLQLDFNIFR